MESQILHELESIRAYVSIVLLAIIIWSLFKITESAQNIYTGFRKAWETDFDNRMSRFQDTGEYQEIIEECNEKLKKYPNHLTAIWYLAKAYFYVEENTLSKEYFEKAIYLSPSWEEDAKVYIDKINER